MRWFFTAVLFFTAFQGISQDLTGIWRGNFVSAGSKMNDLFNLEDRYKYEVQIDQRGKEFSGVTYSYKKTEFYGKAASTGTVNPTTGKIILQETKLLELKMASSSYACWMICFLQYTKNGDEEFLEGKYSSYRESDSSFCGRGNVYLRRVVTSDFYKEPFLAKRAKEKKLEKAKTEAPVAVAKKPADVKKTAPAITKKPATKPATTVAKNAARPGTTPLKKDQPVVANTGKEIKGVNLMPELNNVKKGKEFKLKDPAVVPPVLKSRINELVQTITVSSPDVTVSLYDNGTIDHDTVSVYLDNKLVVAHQMLTTAPITVHLKMDDDADYHELVMVADNLGDIPPNTSLMVVKAGDKQYEVRITSTEQKNAVVVFKYEKSK
ncbi:MAG: hypothetical protein KGO82_06625 [Bacteroidota bacterium]|nr:hypothetical protein [Bacteroidota bacterium]